MTAATPIMPATSQASSRAFLDAIRAARGTEAERLFGRLSPNDRAHLARILRQLRD